MKIIAILLVVLSIGGCALTTSGNGLGSNTAENFQIVVLDGESYALDARDGVLYEITKTETGFDISRAVGKIGFRN